MPDFLIDGLSWLQEHGPLVIGFVLSFVALCGVIMFSPRAIRKARRWMREREAAWMREQEALRARKLAEAEAEDRKLAEAEAEDREKAKLYAARKPVKTTMKVLRVATWALISVTLILVLGALEAPKGNEWVIPLPFQGLIVLFVIVVFWLLRKRLLAIINRKRLLAIIKACSPGQITALLVGTGICLLLLALHNPFGGYQTTQADLSLRTLGSSTFFLTFDLGFAHWISRNAICKWIDEPIELIGLMLPVIAFALIVIWVFGLRSSRAEPPAADDA